MDCHARKPSLVELHFFVVTEWKLAFLNQQTEREWEEKKQFKTKQKSNDTNKKTSKNKKSEWQI